MKIACDVCVSNRSIKYLQEQGFEIVAKAGHGEPDAIWFARALEMGAIIFISADLDLATLVERQYDKKLFWLNFPSMAYGEGKANQWLNDRLLKLKEVWGL